MPPLTMIIVIPSVPMATITVCVKMILKFPPVRKYGLTVELSENNPITSSSPRKGPSTFKMRREAVGFLNRALFQILIQRRMQEVFDFGLIHILLCDQHHARINP